jgi:two-component system response regulator NreC
MDVSMPEIDGIRTAGKIQDLGISTQIIMLSMHHNSTLVQQARKNGATGYIIKQQANRDLIPAIRAAYEGTLSL